MDSHYFTAFCYETIKKGLPNSKVKDAERLVNWARVVKSDAEINQIVWISGLIVVVGIGLLVFTMG